MKATLKTTLPKNNRIKKTYSIKQSEGRAALFFMLPSLLGLALFFFIPFVDTIRRSFSNTRGDGFVGFSGYTKVLGNSAFQLASGNTAKFISICIPILMVFSLVLALLAARIYPSGHHIKTGYLLPMAIPVASVALLWQVLFSNKGLINAGLVNAGAQPVDFINSNAAFWVLVGTYVWKNCGYDMILWLAGLDAIPQSQYEAAYMDGGNAWQCFWRITLPGLIPTFGMVGVLSLLNSFKAFREAYLVAGSYPHDSIYLLQHLFNNWFANLEIARLSVATVLVAAVLLVVIMIALRFLKEEN